MNNDDLKKIGKLLDQRLEVTEARFDKKLQDTEDRLGSKISKSEKSIVGDMVDFVSNQLMPVIDEKADKTDIERLERKMDFITDRVLDHEKRIKKTEQRIINIS